MSELPDVDAGRPWSPDVSWRVARALVQTWYEPLTDLRTFGRDRVPREGPCVLAMNHLGVLDPILIGMASPRVVRYMAKRELFDLPVLRSVIGAFGAFSVRRGSSDREAIVLARRHLRAGHCLGVFVEGTRQPTSEIGVVKPGAAMLAMAEAVPVIPVCLQLSPPRPTRPLLAPRVAFGTPLDLSAFPRNARGYRSAAAEIEDELRRLRSFIISTERASDLLAAVPPVTQLHEPSAEVPHGRP